MEYIWFDLITLVLNYDRDPIRYHIPSEILLERNMHFRLLDIDVVILFVCKNVWNWAHCINSNYPLVTWKNSFTSAPSLICFMAILIRTCEMTLNGFGESLYSTIECLLDYQKWRQKSDIRKEQYNSQRAVILKSSCSFSRFHFLSGCKPEKKIPPPPSWEVADYSRLYWRSASSTWWRVS